MRSRSFLGQVAPTKGAARILAEHLSASANGLTYSPKISNPENTLYPGRMIFRPEEASLYVISFRPGFGGNVYLYEIEGPGQGNWKQVPVDLLNTFFVVSEPESGAVRDIAPTITPNIPVGMVSDVLYSTALLEAAMTILGTTFPPMEGLFLRAIDQNKIAAMAAASISASTLAMSAIDGAGVAYDTMVIGRKALLLLNYIGATVLGTSLELINYTIHSEDPNNIALACSKVFELSKRFPLFGLYLERAYYWANLDDVTDLKLLRNDALLYVSDLAVNLDKINTGKDHLISNGHATQEEIDSGVLLGRNFLKTYWSVDTAFSKTLGDALKEEKITTDDLVYSAMTLPLLIEMNKKAIEGLQSSSKVQGIQNLEGLGSIGYFGVGGGGKSRIEKAVLDRYNSVTAEMERMVSRDIKTSDPKLYDKYIVLLEQKALEGGIFSGLFDALTGRLKALVNTSDIETAAQLTPTMTVITTASETRGTGVQPLRPSEILYGHLEELTEKLKSTPSEPASEEYLTLAREVYLVRETLQLLETDASGLKPNVAARFLDYRSILAQSPDERAEERDNFLEYQRTMRHVAEQDIEKTEKVKKPQMSFAKYRAKQAAFTSNMLEEHIKSQLSVLMLPGARKLFYAREGSPDFLEIARELVALRDSLRFSNASMRAIIDSIADNSNLDPLTFRGELAKACYEIIANAQDSYEYATTNIKVLSPRSPADFKVFRTAKIPVLEYQAEMDKYVSLIDISSAPNLRGLSRNYIELNSSTKGRVDPMTGKSVIVPVDPVARVIIKAYRAELNELYREPDVQSLVIIPAGADVEKTWDSLPEEKRIGLARFLGLPVENGRALWNGLVGSSQDLIIEYFQSLSIGGEVTEAVDELNEAEDSIILIDDMIRTGTDPTQEQVEAVATNLERAEVAVQAVTFKTRFKAAASKVFLVLRSIRKIRTASFGPAKIYKFLTKIGWKKIAAAIGIGGLVLSTAVLSVKSMRADLPYDPKADDPPSYDGSGLKSTLINVGIAAATIIGGIYLFKKGAPLIKNWWMKSKVSPASVTGLSGLFGFSSLPKRRKTRKKATRRHKRRTTYPGPGKNFMEMQ